jgi:molybdopterin-guanine dinucleotide biosynthesis protein A
VSITKPDNLDYNEELYESLQSRNKDVLHRFFNYYADQIDERPVERSAHTQDQLCKIIAAKLEEEITDFLEQHNRLVEESVRVDPALDFLAEHYDIDPEHLDAGNRYELLLLLYETDLVENLNELGIRSRIRSYSATRAYVLAESLGFDDLPQRLQQFHSEWNKEQDDPEAILVDKEFETENIAVLKIY